MAAVDRKTTTTNLVSSVGNGGCHGEFRVVVMSS